VIRDEWLRQAAALLMDVQQADIEGGDHAQRAHLLLSHIDVVSAPCRYDRDDLQDFQQIEHVLARITRRAQDRTR
jgi:hypothetical protein